MYYIYVEALHSNVEFLLNICTAMQALKLCLSGLMVLEMLACL